jgi:hypothetical protein
VSRFLIFPFYILVCAANGADLEMNQVDRKLFRQQEKCAVELQHSFVPLNCFRWVNMAPLNREKKEFLRDWFDAACRKALQINNSVSEFHIQHISEVGRGCQKNLAEAFKEWSYTAKEEQPTRLLSLFVKSGKKIEYTAVDEVDQAKRNKNHRINRRGPN